ncbi:MAG: hypothetical protein HOC05_17120 [Gemmatimonadetes bacterium]|jgi:antirestriction protein ArdC|nr:hypothetical protein [Gemmatimonadota bacterium]MBT5141085.1 hypothetical protein [Gemmatimonadota bacterium]MBT5592072.1 hypothetical protein [Gemmatimonadota bacterium]MBT5964654.1 hypothetical protein [Gemmatimonadota bacterium]MBT6628363.1 hypothetical protein [Gemmatimonadota bacterium]
MKTTQKAQDVLQQLLSAFEQGTVPTALARTCIPPINVPCHQWSFNNQLLVFLSETNDARGIRQWKNTGRWPKKGSKAIYILGPMTIKKTEENDRGEAEEQFIITGFKAIPVFRVEDTTGKDLDYPPIQPSSPPPLVNVAEDWGVNVRYAPSKADYYGYFAPTSKEIVLCTHDEDVFFHELAHAAHERINGKLQSGQQWDQEIVAELSAATLMHLYGRQPQDGRAYQYINAYAQRAGKDTHKACLSVLDQVQQVLNLIIQRQEQAAKAA